MKQAITSFIIAAALIAGSGTASAESPAPQVVYATTSTPTYVVHQRDIKCPRGKRGGAIASVVLGSVFGLGLVGIPLIASGSVKLARHNKAKRAGVCGY